MTAIPPTLASLDESEQCRMLLELIRDFPPEHKAGCHKPTGAPLCDCNLAERLAALGLGGGE